MRPVTQMTLSILVLSTAVLAADFRFSRIDVPNASATTALGVNARGDIVGRYNDHNGVTHGFLFHQGSFSTIDFPHASFTAPRAINARGDIVGRVIDAAGNEHGFLLRDGDFKKIDYPGASATTARGINNAGDITGRHFDAAGNESGFILQDRKFFNVRVPDSATPLHPCSADVWMAMDNGRVAVGDLCTDSDGGIHGYLRNTQGDFQIIDFPGAGAPCTAVRWINERKDLVGVYANTLDECFAFQAHGFLLRQGVYTPIDFPRSVYSEAFSISDDGVIVGDFTDGQGNTHGYKAVPSD
jgi:probable HAF family extracellular repeat protein